MLVGVRSSCVVCCVCVKSLQDVIGSWHLSLMSSWFQLLLLQPAAFLARSTATRNAAAKMDGLHWNIYVFVPKIWIQSDDTAPLCFRFDLPPHPKKCHRSVRADPWTPVGNAVGIKGLIPGVCGSNIQMSASTTLSRSWSINQNVLI